jgi:hypothetical protein
MKYIFEIKTDDDFNILYLNQPTRYCDNFTILFNFHNDNYDCQKVLEVLKRIKLVSRPNKEDYCKDAEKLFRKLKNKIKNNPHPDDWFGFILGGNYTFSFTQSDNVDLVVDC